VLGAVTATGEYIMIKGDFRLTDAIVMAPRRDDDGRD